MIRTSDAHVQSSLSVMHAVQDSFSEAYVRRHLLFTARNRVKYHHNWQRVTTFALIPLSPLALSPFPNIPIYYIGYRVYSHNRARAGADTVLEYLEHLETYKPSAPDPDSQPYNKGQSSLHNSFDYSVTTHVRFRPCADLSQVAAPRDRCAPSLHSFYPPGHSRVLLPSRGLGVHAATCAPAPSAESTAPAMDDAQLACVCREASALPDDVAQAIAGQYDDRNIVSAIVKIRKRADQGVGPPDASDSEPARTWTQWLQRLW